MDFALVWRKVDEAMRRRLQLTTRSVETHLEKSLGSMLEIRVLQLMFGFWSTAQLLCK
jgi:hypothetical protein